MRPSERNRVISELWNFEDGRIDLDEEPEPTVYMQDWKNIGYKTCEEKVAGNIDDVMPIGDVECYAD